MDMKTLNDFDPCPIGPHRGTILRSVPADYLLSLTAADVADYPALAAYIKMAEKVLRLEIKEQQMEDDK